MFHKDIYILLLKIVHYEWHWPLKNYLKKGQEVAVSGELNLNKYTKNDGQQGASLECNVNSVDMIGGRNAQDHDQQTQGGQSKSEANQYQPTTNDLDDDIPF